MLYSPHNSTIFTVVTNRVLRHLNGSSSSSQAGFRLAWLTCYLLLASYHLLHHGHSHEVVEERGVREAGRDVVYSFR